jgi:CheY-like chemotaxis protein
MSSQVRRVLVVDDDPDFLFQMKTVLESKGFEVSAASNRVEAEKLMDLARPDIAVLDLMMENEDDGFVLGYHLKKRYPGVPVILVTAVTRETGLEFDEADDSHGWIRADAILPKPIRFEQLLKEIDRLTDA